MGSLEMPLTGIWKISMESLTPISQAWGSLGSIFAVLATDAFAIFQRRSGWLMLFILFGGVGGSTVVLSSKARENGQECVASTHQACSSLSILTHEWGWEGGHFLTTSFSYQGRMFQPHCSFSTTALHGGKVNKRLGTMWFFAPKGLPTVIAFLKDIFIFLFSGRILLTTWGLQSVWKRNHLHSWITHSCPTIST